MAPGVLGLSLAAPWRRLAAMLIDLLASAIVGALGWSLVSLSLAGLLAMAAWRGRVLGGRPLVRIALASLAALLVAAALVGAWRNVGDASEGGLKLRTSVEGAEVPPSVAFALLPDVLALREAEDPALAQEVAERMARRVRQAFPNPVDADAALRSIAREMDAPAGKAALDALLAPTGALPPAEAEGVRAARAWADAMEAGEIARADELAADLARTVAGPRVRDLEERLKRSREETRELEADAAERRGVLWALRTIADELGLSLGWAYAYFTIVTVLWGGRTLGKRLLGIRVVRMDGRPVGWWSSFSRASGYSASLLTGLLGFAELLWDDNRQALHDKACGTVVVRDSPAG